VHLRSEWFSEFHLYFSIKNEHVSSYDLELCSITLTFEPSGQSWKYRGRASSGREGDQNPQWDQTGNIAFIFAARKKILAIVFAVVGARGSFEPIELVFYLLSMHLTLAVINATSTYFIKYLVLFLFVCLFVLLHQCVICTCSDASCMTVGLL